MLSVLGFFIVGVSHSVVTLPTIIFLSINAGMCGGLLHDDRLVTCWMMQSYDHVI